MRVKAPDHGAAAWRIDQGTPVAPIARALQEARMGKFTLVLFHDEKRALKGFHAIEDLRASSSISVRGAALVERDEYGVLSLRKGTDPMDSGLGAVVARAPSELLEFLARDLAPGTFAIVAELSADRIAPIEARMEPLGGTVVSEWRKPATSPPGT